MTSADNLSKGLDPDQARQNDTLMIFLKEFFEKVDFEKKSADNKKIMQNYPVDKEL